MSADKLFRIVVIIACSWCATLPRARGAEARDQREPTGPSIKQTAEGILKRLEIGVRMSHYGLTDDNELHFDEDGEIVEGYLGSITELNEIQDHSPTLYANFRIIDWLTLQLAYERFDLRTGRYWDDDTDGWFQFNGPSLTAQFRYNNHTCMTPYVGAGGALLSVDFEMIGWWHNGFGGPDAHENYANWVESGSPEWPNGGYQRNLKVVDDLVLKPVFQAGCEVAIGERIRLDIDSRYILLDSKLEYTLARHGEVFDDRGRADFPMEAWIIDFGVLFAF